ncbi:MAG: transposase [Bacteroidales bacterium]|nr:transposase [Bacteroidales bacterium]
MKTGRPAKASTIYKVSIHNNGGRKYASTQPYTVDDNGKKHYTHKHWGIVDDDMRFHPNSTYFFAPIEERRKLIFPSGWDLSEIKTLSGTGHRGAVEYEGGDLDRMYGPTWFLDNVARATGLLDDLQKVFGGNLEMAQDVLTLAYYLFLDSRTYSHIEKWQRVVKTPSVHTLTSSSITRLSQNITEQNRMDLFRLRAKRMSKGEYCAVDSTSVSTYGFHLVDIRWGHNKEHLPLKQTLEVIVYSLTSHLPIYYLELPGNMPDSRTVEMIVTELEHAGFRNVILITDRGYESLKNLEVYIAKGQKVISSVKCGQGEALKAIKSIDLSTGVPEGMTFSKDTNLFYRQYDLDYQVQGNGDHVIKADRLKLNVYFDIHKRADDLARVQMAITTQTEVVQAVYEAGKPVPKEDRDTFRRENNFMKIAFWKSGKVRSFEVDKDAVKKATLTSGFFASKTLGLDLDPMEAKSRYGMRDEQEKTFMLQKGPLGEDRLRVCTESSKHGRMFICFVALILASYIRHIRDTKPELTKVFPSMASILEEMQTVRCIEHDGHRKFITPFVGDQITICDAFGFDIPEGCRPTYTSRRSVKGKRGRPAKPMVETS